MSRRSHSSPKAPEPEADLVEDAPEVVIDEAEVPEPVEAPAEDIELEVDEGVTVLAEDLAAPAIDPIPDLPQNAGRYSLDHALGAIDVHVEPEFDTNTLLLTIRSPATGVALHLSPEDAGAIGGVLVNWALNHGFRT